MINTETTKPPLSFGEFVVLMALMISLVALSIDAMLPALPEIGQSLGVVRDNDNQLIITFLLLGLSIGQIIYGPVSDSTGRKRPVYVGFGLFIIGSIISLVATNFTVMLVGRVLQGVGAAGPRIVTMALIRDQYEGRAMAQVMSFVVTVFILIPAIAPLFGQAILLVAHWRAIFGVFLVIAVITLTWFTIRQPETLPPSRREPFSLPRIFRAIGEVCTNRISFGYTIATGLVFGGLLGYINLAQQMFQDQYGLGLQFPFYFAALALTIGLASFLNARLVTRFGMRALSRSALQIIGGLSVVFFPIAFVMNGHPPLWLLMTHLLISFFCVGLLFGNLNALAMEPLGHIAGVGAAVISSLSTLIAVLLGLVIGQIYNNSVLPLVGGFAILGIAALMTMWWVEAQGKRVSKSVVKPTDAHR